MIMNLRWRIERSSTEWEETIGRITSGLYEEKDSNPYWIENKRHAFRQDVTALPKIGISSKTGISKKNGIPSVINDFFLGLRVTQKGNTIVGGD